MSGAKPLQAGFSLVELMVVIVLMGLSASIVVLTWPRGEDGVVKEAERFAGDVGRAAQESILSGRLMGVRVTPSGYQFLIYEDRRWRPLADNRAFASRRWEQTTSVRFSRSGEARDLDREATFGPAERRKTALIPDLILDPIGMMTPFTLTLEGADGTMRITGDGSGSLTLDQEGRL